MKQKTLLLSLNKDVIDQLDKVELSNIKGGNDFTTIIGSNCNNSDPNAHECCGPITTMPDGGCGTYTTEGTC